MSKPALAADVSKIEVLDGKLHIFRRKDTQNWWCGYHHKGVYRRTSTRQADLNAAIEAAKRWYYGEQHQISLGQGVEPVRTKDTFAHHAQLAIAKYQEWADNGARSQKYAKSLRHLIENHLIPFFGKHKLTSVNQSLWNDYVEKKLNPRNLKQITKKQHLNGIRSVFLCARVRGSEIPTPEFHSPRKAATDATPRTWFNEAEQLKLFTALHQNIKDKKGTRWEFAAFELLDYVTFMINSGLRIDEGKNLRFKDVHKITETDEHGVMKPTLFLEPVRGKRGTGSCKTKFGAVQPFDRIVKRRNLASSWQTSSEPVFLEHHRDMFNTVLKSCDLKFTNSIPPLRRDLMSLRHSYICMQIIAGVDIYAIASTCRTSLPMIQNNYARWLAPARANINKSKPPSDEQQKQANEKAVQENMPKVLEEFTKALEDAEKEFMASGPLRGAQSKANRKGAAT